MDNILEVKNLSVSFQTFFGEVEAVRNISFTVRRGETLAVVGESGCGKSVTANSIVQLLPQPPAIYKNGEILFNGDNLLKKNKKEIESIRGNLISMVFQDPMTSLNPTMKVGTQIVEGLRKHRSLSAQQAHKIAVETLKLVSVPQAEKRANQYPHEFSGGMRQRVMIAIAMVSEPALLIADEPTTALDVTVQAQILDLMKKIKEEKQTSIILITHDLGVVADMAERVVVMYAGQILEEGTVLEIFKSPSHPYTKNLLKAVPRLDMNRSESLYSIAGSPPDLYIPPKGCSFYDRCDSAMRICKEHMPELESHSPTHKSRCWLHHPMAMQQKEAKG